MSEEQEQRCFVCGGHWEEKLVRHVEWTDTGPVIFEGVPARVCEHCGETAIQSRVWDVIERVTRERPAPARVISVPVYDLAEAQVATA